jgi:alpha-glucosidase (family GH31 glycosyl hydrolase)
MVLFNTSMTDPVTFNGLMFKDQYLSLTTQLPANANLYGLGEATNSKGFRLDTTGHTYTLWNRDTPSTTADQNLYGSHPFYMQVRWWYHALTQYPQCLIATACYYCEYNRFFPTAMRMECCCSTVMAWILC